MCHVLHVNSRSGSASGMDRQCNVGVWARRGPPWDEPVVVGVLACTPQPLRCHFQWLHWAVEVKHFPLQTQGFNYGLRWGQQVLPSCNANPLRALDAFGPTQWVTDAYIHFRCDMQKIQKSFGRLRASSGTIGPPTVLQQFLHCGRAVRKL